jgi:Domain of Unknown Function (DUF928)
MSIPAKFLYITAILWLHGQQLLAQTTSLKYVPDPTFSALSRKGTPKDIIHGGGKRGACLTRADPARGLTAILPANEYGGLSATTSPTFWVYLPYATEAKISGVLSIRTTDSFSSAPLVKVPVTLPSQPGLVRLKLPESIEHRQMLAWTLTVICDEQNLSRNPFISGLVMVKPNPELLNRVAGLSKSERVVEFARSGYWYDALALVGEDGEKGVQRLMESAGLK